jgi:adenine deaminase
LNAAEHFRIPDVGAVAPGYTADLLILDDLDSVKVCDVYKNGNLVVENGELVDFSKPAIPKELENRVRGSLNFKPLSVNDFMFDCNERRKCNIIKILKGQILTEKIIDFIDFSENNGIDTQKDILKIAVVERHHKTGHIGLGFINGAGLRSGAIASSVSHDSHNLIVIGQNENDMLIACERIRDIGGGLVAVENGKIICEMPLPIAGLMSDEKADICAEQNENIRIAAHKLGCPDDVEPFMNMSFVSLPVIPHIKLTTLGLFDVDNFCLIPLFAD